MGKICIAVDEDIDADNADAILWAMAYRMTPSEDIQILDHRGQGHGPKREHGGDEDSTLLIDATMKGDLPPLALPTREYMERAKNIWEELGLSRRCGLNLRPGSGYSLSDCSTDGTSLAARAAKGEYLENGRISLGRRKKGLKPETKFRPPE